MTDAEASYREATEPSVDFDYPTEAADITPLAILAGLLAWSGSSRARHAVISVLLGQDTRSQSELARSIAVSRQAIQVALKQGRFEITRLTRGGPF